MKTGWRRYSPFLLYLSLLAALVSAGALIVHQWNATFPLTTVLIISLSVAVLGVFLYIIYNPKQVVTVMTGRQARYGLNALVMTIAFLGIMVVINYLVYGHSKQWDLTADKSNTLATETLDTLDKLPQTVTVQAFYSSQMSTETAQGLFDQYKNNSQGKFEYEFIDPNRNPALAQQENITQDGTIILKMGERQERVNSATEQNLTSALVRLMNPEKRAIYFLTGHGEHNPDGSGDASYSRLKGMLKTKNYTVQVLNLLANSTIPDDARVIVIAGPKKPLAEGEVQLLADYLSKGGSLVVLEDPVLVTEFGDTPDPLAGYLAQTWGVSLGNDIVIDMVGQQLLGQPFVAVGVDYSSHEITSKFQGMATYFPTARSVTTPGDMAGITRTKLVMTAPQGQSWAESDVASLNAGQNPTPDQAADIIGSVPLAVSAENSSSQARLIVFGNSGFASDGNIDAGGNTDLVVNALDWSAKQEDIINLTPKQTTERVLVPPQPYTIKLIFFGSVCALPFGVLLAGAIAWIVRRRRG